MLETLVAQWMENYAAAETDGGRAEIVSSFAAAFARAAASFKDESFAEEREWRLVRFSHEGTSGVRYREGLSTLIPYLVYQLPLDTKLRLLLPRVIVGPTPNMSLSRRAIVRMLKERSVGWQQVTPSRTPFRAW